MSQFPSMKASRLLAVLQREPLSYRVRGNQFASSDGGVGQTAPHFRLSRQATIPAGLVRKILTKDVGLAEDEARKLL